VVLDATGNQVVELFHHTNTGKFLLHSVEFGKRDTCCLPIAPKATPFIMGNREEQHIQLTRNKEKVKDRL
jgi:hypothetical protein